MTEVTNKAQVFHNIKSSQTSFPLNVFILFIIAVLVGVGSGYVLAKHATSPTSQSGSNASSSGSLVKGAIYGSGDTSTFKDTADGVMQKGGIGNDGQYHLVRPGGASQYVYLTSSLVDLSQFIGHKVKVWGQTQKAQQAGWLMDVGRVEVDE